MLTKANAKSRGPGAHRRYNHCYTVWINSDLGVHDRASMSSFYRICWWVMQLRDIFVLMLELALAQYLPYFLKHSALNNI